MNLAERLGAARHSVFVGRAAELALFGEALAAGELPFFLLYVFGPGGVGKTSLLREFERLAADLGRPIYRVDGRDVDPRPDAFASAVRQAAAIAPERPPGEALAERPGRQVVVVDTYERLQPLDRWLSQEFLPAMPDHVLFVLAGRNPPGGVWRADPGWQALMRPLPMRNLSPEESRAYLALRQVPEEQHAALLGFTRGHPLALSLVADVVAQGPERPQRSGKTSEVFGRPDVIQALLERLAQNVPSPAHRTALETCALVRLTTEALLAEMVAAADAHDLFDWLRGLSIVESGPAGVFPHDLAREILMADLRWRNRDRYTELHRRARAFYAGRLRQKGPGGQQATIIDYIFLHRENPVIKPFFAQMRAQPPAPLDLLVDSARPEDWEELAAIVGRHEGEEAARLARFWFERQPAGVEVVRDAAGQAAGLLVTLALERLGAEEEAADPAVGAALGYLERHSPLRPGERASYFRFWMARDSYQGMSGAQGVIGVATVRHYLTNPGLAASFFPCARPELWAPIMAYADFRLLPEAAFSVGGREYGVYGRDWRRSPPTAWLDLLAERETSARPAAAPAAGPVEPLVVLSRPTFEEAVRQALRRFARPEALADNPLLRSRLVLEEAGAEADDGRKIAALQALLAQAVEQQQAAPRTLKCYRALYHTYLQPAPTQEVAAELLDVPFGTFRRHLKEGVNGVVALLWQQEVEGSGT